MEDLVELILAGETLITAKEYSISLSVMATPNNFSIVIGTGTSALSLMRKYPAGTPFVLKINGVVQFMGWTDGYERPKGEHTEIHITGRDRMAQLLDDCVEHDRTFTNATFEDLARAMITGAGITDYNLTFDARAHAKAITGTPIVEETKVYEKQLLDFNQLYAIDSSGFPPGTDLNFAPYDVRSKEDITVTVEKVVKKIKGYKAEKPIEWKAGTTFYAAGKKEFDRGGLFLRGGVDPLGKQPNTFLLSEPNAAQEPLFGLVNTREPNPADNMVSVLPPHITDSVVGRHAKYIVRGRTGGGKKGREPVEGIFIDQQMVELGFTTRKVVIDDHAKTNAQALYLARKLCTEARRMHRVFTYHMPRRHTAPLLRDPSRRAILAPDICVSLKDDENGMEGVFYSERVRHMASASGPTGTDITIMVPEDLVYGDAEFLTNATRKVSGRHWGHQKR